MATKAQIMELENQIRDLKWELKEKDNTHKEEMEELARQHREEMEELKQDMSPMTRKDVAELIKSKLSLRINSSYNGYIEASLYFDGECITSCDDHITCESNPLDE